MHACISFLKHVNLSLCTILFQTNVSYIYIYILYIASYYKYSNSNTIVL